MALKIPAELKKITQYIRRAEELSSAKVTPETLIVAYHCRQYAVQTGIPLAASAEGKKCLGDILTILEEHRSKMANFSKDEKYSICKDFAYKIFDKADNEDRAGQSSKATARTFYAAASFLDILKQFQSDEDKEDDEVVEQQKMSFYAKWKATDILKAIKEGREIKPGGYGETPADDDDEEGQGIAVSADGSMENVDPPPPYPADSAAFKPPPMAPMAAPESLVLDIVYPSAEFLPPPINAPVASEDEDEKEVAPPAPAQGIFSLFSSSTSVGKKKHSKAAMQDAKELTTFALKALEERDGDLAVQRLQQALAALGH